MTTTTNFNFRVDSEVKKQSEALFGQLGVNLTTALNGFWIAFITFFTPDLIPFTTRFIKFDFIIKHILSYIY